MPILLLLFLLLFPNLAHAQSTGDLYSSTVNQGNVYRADYAGYIQAKNQHIQYNTASTRLDAISKTTKVLESRNLWEVNYLKYLRQSLADATNIANYPQTVAFLDLETQVKNMSDQAGSFIPLDSFDKVNTASSAWEGSLTKVDVLVAAAQMQIASAKLAALQDSFAGQLTNATNKMGTPSAANQSTLDLIQNKYTSSVTGRQKVDQALNGFKTNGFYKGNLVSALNLSKSDLLDAAKLLIELVSQAHL